MVWTGTSPAVTNLKRKYTYQVSVASDGYETAELGLRRGTNGWVVGNLLFGGLIGLGIDFGTGAAYKIKPDDIFIELTASSEAAQADRSNVAPGADREGARQPDQEAITVSRSDSPTLSPPASRKGFIIGFGLGPGLTSFTYAVSNQNGGKFVTDRETKTALATDLKIGYAPNDQLQFYWMSKVSWMRFRDSNIIFTNGFGGLGSNIIFTNGFGGLGGSYRLSSVSPLLFLNGGVGLASWATPFEQDNETLLGLGLVVGGEFEFSPHWIFDVDLMWGRPSKDQLSVNPLSLKLTVNYLHY